MTSKRRENARGRRRRTFIGLAFGMVLSGAFALWASTNFEWKSAPPELLVVRLVMSDATLMERGIVEPVDTVPVKVGASGDILELKPSGTPVEAGEVVLKIDDSGIVDRITEDELNIQLEEIESTVRAARRAQVELEQNSRLDAVRARLRMARLDGESLKAGLTDEDSRLLEIELELTRLDWLDAHDELERQKRLHERGFIADAVLDRYVRREATAAAALNEKKLQNERRNQPPRPEVLLENQRTVERYNSELARGQSAMERRLARIDADIKIAQLQQDLRSFNRERNAEDLTLTETPAATSGVLRVRMYTNWRTGGIWQPYAPGVYKNKFDTIADIVTKGSFRVDVMVHESDIHRVQPGQRARIRVGAYPNRVFSGRVANVGGVGRDRQEVAPRGYEDSPSGVTMFNVTIHFSDAGDADLHPGMSALVEIELEPRQKRLLVPREAVGKQGDEWVVTLPAGRRHSESKAVRVRSFDALHYEIEEGLSEGESILARWRP